MADTLKEEVIRKNLRFSEPKGLDIFYDRNDIDGSNVDGRTVYLSLDEDMPPQLKLDVQNVIRNIMRFKEVIT